MARGANFRKIPKRVFHLSDGTRSNDFLCGFNPDNNDTAIYKGNYIHGVATTWELANGVAMQEMCRTCAIIQLRELIRNETA